MKIVSEGNIDSLGIEGLIFRYYITTLDDQYLS
jgi:hypothetical protein